MSEIRKLSTIVFADIAGYTSLMQNDEKKALQFLSGFKEVVELETKLYDGKVVQYFGDACLLSFDSSTNALNCAIAFQKEFLGERKIPVRIGVHLGEVVYTENNVFGDGVNIASRIESLGVSGSILISGQVRNQVRNKPEFELQSLGSFDFKNVQDRIEVYAVINPGIVLPRREELKGKLKPKASNKIPRGINIILIIFLLISIGLFLYTQYADSSPIDDEQIEKSIAVLPFRNDSPDETNIYFCNGIMEGVLENLAKIPDLSVVSRTSVEQYRDNPPSSREIADQLGVNYLLEGSVMRIGDRAVINAQLIYAKDDRHLWSDRYDKEVEDIFLVLSEVTRSIAENLNATISSKVMRNIENKPTTDLTAYDYYLQGKEYLNNFHLGGHKEDLQSAERLFQNALQGDSTFALAYVGLARILTIQHQFNFYNSEKLVDSMLNLCNKAIILDPHAADAYWIRGTFYDDFLFDIPKAEADLNRALELNPNHVGAIRQIGHLKRLHHKDVISSYELYKTLERLDRSAKELNLTYQNFMWLYWDIGYWEKGLVYLNKIIDIDKDMIFDLAFYHLLKGDPNKAIELLNSVEENSQKKLVSLGIYNIYARQYELALGYFEQWASIVKKDGVENEYGVKDWHRYGQVLIEVGKKEEGTQLMIDQLELNKKLLVNFQSGYKILYESAGIYSFLGEKDRSIEYLLNFDKTNRWQTRIYLIQLDPLFDNIRNEAEIQSLIEKELTRNEKIRMEIDSVEARGTF